MMNKIFLAFLICIAVLMNTGVTSFAVEVEKVEKAAYQIPVNDEGVEAVTIVLADGAKVVAYILRETEGQVFLQNLNESMEVSFPRSKIAEIRKPTVGEIRKQQKSLGMESNPKPSQETKQ